MTIENKINKTKLPIKLLEQLNKSKIESKIKQIKSFVSSKNMYLD